MLEKIYLIPENNKNIKVYHSPTAITLEELDNQTPDITFTHYLDAKDYAKNFYVEGIKSWEEKAKRYFEIIFKTTDIIIGRKSETGPIQIVVKLAVTADGQPCKKLNDLPKKSTILIHEYTFNVLKPYEEN